MAKLERTRSALNSAKNQRPPLGSRGTLENRFGRATRGEATVPGFPGAVQRAGPRPPKLSDEVRGAGPGPPPRVPPAAGTALRSATRRAVGPGRAEPGRRRQQHRREPAAGPGESPRCSRTAGTPGKGGHRRAPALPYLPAQGASGPRLPPGARPPHRQRGGAVVAPPVPVAPRRPLVAPRPGRRQAQVGAGVGARPRRAAPKLLRNLPFPGRGEGKKGGLGGRKGAKMKKKK